MTLDELSPGKSGVVAQVGGSGALRARLLDMGLLPGTRVTMLREAPFGDPLELRLRGYTLSLRRADAAKVVLRG